MRGHHTEKKGPWSVTYKQEGNRGVVQKLHEQFAIPIVSRPHILSRDIPLTMIVPSEPE